MNHRNYELAEENTVQHNEIQRLKLIQQQYDDLVDRATLNKTVLHLTGRFACLLREYGTSDSEILHADMVGEIELLAKELSSLLSQLMGSFQRRLFSLFYVRLDCGSRGRSSQAEYIQDIILLRDDSAYGMTARRPD